jgi:cell wall-associated protease
MKSIVFYLLLILSIFYSCKTSKDLILVSEPYHSKNKKLSLQEKESWSSLDILEDTIPGISLNKTYNLILKNKKSNQVIVALLDNVIKKDHEALENHIWLNAKEIPNNGKDDDANGYIDDTQGWNFLGNNKGENIVYANYEATRFVRYYDERFKNIDSVNMSNNDKEIYYHYKRAKEYIEKELKITQDIVDGGIGLITNYKDALKEVSPYVLEKDISKSLLDSLVNEKPDLSQSITLISQIYAADLSLEELELDLKSYKNKINYYLNVDYDDREVIGDNSNNITDVIYGNNLISENTEKLSHGTYTSKLILGEKDEILIMPLAISVYGDEQDKDIALAIKYAVDNGAKVINISSGKSFSLHENWVDESMKYAEDHDVLVITSASNNGSNLDDENIFNYPNDTDIRDNEIVANFIKVGASTYTLNENLKSKNSNYGKREVDIFAPGYEIYTASPHPEKYKYLSGTSLAAPLVSKVAALLFSYYPTLTAAEVKQIIMESGVEYAIPVAVPTEENPDQLIPFNELSKSGKIVNAYNAFILAEQIVKKK